MHIPDRIIDTLTSRGLVVGDPFPSDHIAYPDGRCISKPASAGGNRLPGYRCEFCDCDETVVVADAPIATMHADGGFWFVSVHEYVPGPGLGDFVNKHQTPELAADDLLDYYFGDPARMMVKLPDCDPDDG